MMRHIVNKSDGGYEVLAVEETEDPIPKEGELVIGVRAAGLNFADILARKGQYQDAPDKPCVMGYEVSGTVIDTGPGVDSHWNGKAVIGMTRFGGQAEKVCVKTSQVFEKPESLSFAEAAVLPVNYLTAWVLIRVMGSLQPEESILIHNAGGGVGMAQIDVARHIGATLYGTASGHKHKFLRDRGLDYPIDYREKNWYKELMKLTGDRGVELVTDPLGGTTSKRSFQALRSTGRLGMFGISTAHKSAGAGIKSNWNLLKTVAGMPYVHPVTMMNGNKGVFGVNIGHLWHEGEKVRIWMRRLLEGVEEGWIRPHVDATYPFDQVDRAHRYVEERRNIGKVLLVPQAGVNEEGTVKEMGGHEP